VFPALRQAVAKILDPAKLRHIAWSHFESDEIGALNDSLQLAPQAQPVCTLVGKLVFWLARLQAGKQCGEFVRK
jgi:flavorubredoxin